MDPKTYLKHLGENQPVFDEFVPTFEKSREPWGCIAGHILSPFPGESKKFNQYIARYEQYRDNLFCKDRLVQMILTKRGKSQLNDRVVHFPFTFTKIKGNQL